MVCIVIYCSVSFLQIRHPEGRPFSQHFPITATLNDVWSFVKMNYKDAINMCLIQVRTSRCVYVICKVVYHWFIVRFPIVVLLLHNIPSP